MQAACRHTATYTFMLLSPRKKTFTGSRGREDLQNKSNSGPPSFFNPAATYKNKNRKVEKKSLPSLQRRTVNKKKTHTYALEMKKNWRKCTRIRGTRRRGKIKPTKPSLCVSLCRQPEKLKLRTCYSLHPSTALVRFFFFLSSFLDFCATNNVLAVSGFAVSGFSFQPGVDMGRDFERLELEFMRVRFPSPSCFPPLLPSAASILSYAQRWRRFRCYSFLSAVCRPEPALVRTRVIYPRWRTGVRKVKKKSIRKLTALCCAAFALCCSVSFVCGTTNSSGRHGFWPDFAPV